MPRAVLIHWNAAEAAERAERVRGEGFECESFSGPGGDMLRVLAEKPPDAIVIDLARVPSHGTAVAVACRQRKATRMVPLVLIEGDPQKTGKVRKLVPDAVFTSWPKIGPALRRAIRNAPERPVVPGTFASYEGTPLPKKLRIRENSVVALLSAPEAFEARLAPLPNGVQFSKRAPNADVILAFFTSAVGLGRRLPGLAQEMREGQTLWLIWPKKTSALAADLNQPEVRKMGLAAGLVDYKICAVDETWSGLAFAKR